MEYGQLGRSDLIVSKIGFGCEQLGGTDWGWVDEDAATAAVYKALDCGINFFDTADVYGLGHSEEILAKALGAHRKDIVIATKFGVNWHDNRGGERAKTFFDSSPKHVVEALEASLRRLQLDCIPLYQIHWPDPATPISETMETLLKCQRDGKIRYIGCSNFSADLLRQACRVGEVTSLQISYSLVDRHIEEDILPACEERGIGVLVYGPLAQGLLTGKYDLNVHFEENDRRNRLEIFRGELFIKNLQLVDKLKVIEGRYNQTLSQIAIRWILDHDSVCCAITGIKDIRQLEENVGALGWRLEPHDWKYLAG